MGNRKAAVLPFNHVSEITEQHAKRFVSALFRLWKDSGALGEAIEAAQIKTYPAWVTGQDVETEEQNAYMATHDRIEKTIEVEIRESLKAAFLKAGAKHLHIPARPAGEAVTHA